jgi:hypothetical protein
MNILEAKIVKSSDDEMVIVSYNKIKLFQFESGDPDMMEVARGMIASKMDDLFKKGFYALTLIGFAVNEELESFGKQIIEDLINNNNLKQEDIVLLPMGLMFYNPNTPAWDGSDIDKVGNSNHGLIN